MNKVTLKTKKGAEVVLTVVAGEIIASHNGKVLGAATEVASKDLGWHLSAGSVAITVDADSVDAAKTLFAAVAASKLTDEQKAKIGEIGEYLRSHDAVVSMGRMGE